MLLIIALIIALPIVFFIIALTCKIFKLMFWCYKPVIFGINFGIKNMGALASSAVGFRNLMADYRPLQRCSQCNLPVIPGERVYGLGGAWHLPCVPNFVRLALLEIDTNRSEIIQDLIEEIHEEFGLRLIFSGGVGGRGGPCVRFGSVCRPRL